MIGYCNCNFTTELLLAGSRDTTVIVWDVQSTVRPAKGRNKGPAPLPIHPVPRHVLSGHSDAIVSVVANYDLDIVVSAPAAGESSATRLKLTRL